VRLSYSSPHWPMKQAELSAAASCLIRVVLYEKIEVGIGGSDSQDGSDCGLKDDIGFVVLKSKIGHSQGQSGKEAVQYMMINGVSSGGEVEKMD